MLNDKCKKCNTIICRETRVKIEIKDFFKESVAVGIIK